MMDSREAAGDSVSPRRSQVAGLVAPQMESQGSIDSDSETRNLLRGSSKTAQSHLGGVSRRSFGQASTIAADWPHGKSPLRSYSKASNSSKWDVIRLDVLNRVRTSPTSRRSDLLRPS